MPNFKKEFQKWLESNEKGQQSLARIIAMMQQSGVEDANNLPDAETDLSPDLLALELNALTTFTLLTDKMKKADFEAIKTAEDVNTFFQRYQKKQADYEDYDYQKEAEVRRQMHEAGQRQRIGRQLQHASRNGSGFKNDCGL